MFTVNVCTQHIKYFIFSYFIFTFVKKEVRQKRKEKCKVVDSEIKDASNVNVPLKVQLKKVKK